MEVSRAFIFWSIFLLYQLFVYTFVYIFTGILVATKYYKTDGPTNQLLYSTDEGINWKSLTFYEKPLKVYGLLTEPGENSTSFTIFGTETGRGKISTLNYYITARCLLQSCVKKFTFCTEMT